MITTLSEISVPPSIGEWLLCAVACMALILLAMKLVDRIKGPAQQPTTGELALRVLALEEEWKALDQKVVNGFASLSDQIAMRNREGEARAEKIHIRIDPILANTGEIKGEMHAFTKSFENFTKVMVAMIEKGTVP